MDPILLKIHEVANLLRVHENTVRNLMADGSLPYVKVGASLRFRTEDVRQFAEASVVKSKAAR